MKGWFRHSEDAALMTSSGLLFTAATCCSPYLEGVVALRTSFPTEIANARSTLTTPYCWTMFGALPMFVLEVCAAQDSIRQQAPYRSDVVVITVFWHRRFC